MITRLRLILGYRARTRAAIFLLMALAAGVAATRREGPAMGYIVTSAFAMAGMPISQCLGTNPAGTFSDNGLVFGSQEVTIGEVEFVAEDINITRGSKRLFTTNQNGVENAQAFMDTTPEGSVTLQLPSAATAAPARYATFSITPVGGGSAQTYIISEVGEKFEAAGETKVTVKVYLSLATEGQSA